MRVLLKAGQRTETNKQAVKYEIQKYNFEYLKTYQIIQQQIFMFNVSRTNITLKILLNSSKLTHMLKFVCFFCLSVKIFHKLSNSGTSQTTIWYFFAILCTYTIKKHTCFGIELRSLPLKIKLSKNNIILHIKLLYLFYSKRLTMENSGIRSFRLVNVLSILLLLQQVMNSGCPAPYLDNYISSGRILAALNDGMIPLNQADDYSCYNYSLQYQSRRAPEVAISVHDFEIQQLSNKLYFYIKPIKTEINSYISFIIKTQWSFTKWNYISFSFLAEDRTDIEAGYYQIDAGILSNCATQKSIVATLPLRMQLSQRTQLKHVVFLHGFQLSTSQISTQRTPFEFRFIESSATNKNISINLTIISQTRVDSIYVSYVIMNSPGFRFQIGNFVYNRTISDTLWFNVETQVGRNYARLQGLTGFVIGAIKSKSTDVSFKTNWDGIAFKFQWAGVQNRLEHFSFNYIFFLGSQCDFCSGYPFSLEGSCVDECPAGYVRTYENTCVNCGPEKEWNGTGCVKSCPRGQYLQTLTDKCICPPGLSWTGQACVLCTNGKVFDKTTLSCECQKGLQWNGNQCVKIPECRSGKIWDVYTYGCKCPQDKYWNDTSCVPLPICFGGQVLNHQFKCVCKDGFHWNGQSCNYSPCLGDQLWTGSICTCPLNQNFNGSMCVQCINGQKWNRIKLTCECDSGYKWNGMLCQKSYICPGNMIWNQTYQQCICPSSTYWSGYKCIPIPKCIGGQYFDVIALKCTCLSSFKWNGNQCIQCKYGKVWNITTLSCSCPLGSVQLNNRCSFQQKCTGGKNWVHSTRSCQCPTSSVWNGNFCIANPCDGGRVWNNDFKSCICINNFIYINGSCSPPKIVCTNGKVWNPLVYACQCPPGTYNNIVRCDQIPICEIGKVYNPLTNHCNCPYGLVEGRFKCVQADCPQGQYYDGYKCGVILCPPPSYFADNKCVVGSASRRCQFSYYWNGQRCVYYPPRCPNGTIWSNFTCVPIGNCPSNHYLSSSGQCAPLPKKCPSSLTWNTTNCISSNSVCPNGTFWTINKCLPYVQCKKSYVWDPIYMKCVCPPGTFSNGSSCIECGNDREWVNGIGCQCPEGTYDSGSACQTVGQSKCNNIANAFWSNKKCVCRPGFTKTGYLCVCQGIQMGSLCDRCSSKQNSQYNWQTNTCQCKRNYIQVKGVCLLSGSRQNQGSDNSDSCSVSTYFDRANSLCVACPPGCLSCTNFNQCITCLPQFDFDNVNDKCIQICGDGKRFFSECDDGNNLDGDGCSIDCRVQMGFQCKGGSPQARDRCMFNIPQQVKLEMIGQIRYQTSIVLNIKASYIPQMLLYSTECGSYCNVLSTTIVSGDKSSLSAISSYIPGSHYVFAITIQFGKPYIGSFEADISINKIWGIRYFGRVSTAQALRVKVNPAYLLSIGNSQRLS